MELIKKNIADMFVLKDNKENELFNELDKIISFSKNNTEFHRLYTRLIYIFSKIKDATIPSDLKRTILEKLFNLSPKKTGTYLEVFNRSTNSLILPHSISYDASNQNQDKVEIKASRVLSNQTEDVYKNL